MGIISNFKEETKLSPGVCSVCHQPILSQYYFCPNCGTKLNSTPLSTTFFTQLEIYLFSIILPMICFVFITRWPGLKYSRSNDLKARRIGFVAWILLILSALIVIWLVWFSYNWLQEAVQSSIESINADLNSLIF